MSQQMSQKGLDMLGPISREGTEGSSYLYSDYDGDYDEDSDAVASPQSPGSSSKAGGAYALKSSMISEPKEPATVFSYQEVSAIMRGVVLKISQLFALEPDKAQVLLEFNRWNEEKVMEKYFADVAVTEKEAGIDTYDLDRINSWFEAKPPSANSASSIVFSFASGDGNPSSSSTTAATIAATADVFTCKICYDEILLSDGFSLGCNHRFCKDCFSQFLRSQVSEGPMCVSSCCPEHKCTQRVTEATYIHFLDEKNLDTYRRYLVRNFIEANKKYRYCPAPNCERVLYSALGQLTKMVQLSENGGISSSSEANNVCCSCGFTSCFQCGEEDHRPCDCFMINKWVEKCMSDSETANWMMVNTKQCPKCNTRIEKNQGCNHMTCRQCRHEFCWLCFGDWRSHNACNRFETTEEGKKVEVEKNKAKHELDRYMHYYRRYQAHDVAMKFAIQQRAVTEKLINSLQQRGESSVEVNFLREAAEQVIACRRVLKYTYVLGYFMSESTEFAPCKLLFEHHQEMLEKNTEKLHEFTEQKDIRRLVRQDVINITRITENFKNNLLEDITDEAMRSQPAMLPTASSSSNSGGDKVSSV